MLVFWLIFAAVISLSAITIYILFSRINKFRIRARQNTADLYKLKTEFKTRQKVFELNQSMFSYRYGGHRKSPVLLMAEQFKKKFELGKFVVFCSDRNILLPLMGVGFKLRGLKPFRVERLLEIVASPGQNIKGGEASFPIGGSSLKRVLATTGLPEGLQNTFSYCYRFSNHTLVFVGEDKRGALAELCTFRDFNRAVWPLLFDICKNSNNLKKHQEKIKTLQEDLNSAQGELGGLARKLKNRSIDIHSFYEISNRLFTIYNERRLLESFDEAVRKVLNPSKTAILGADESEKAFEIIVSGGNSSGEMNLRLPVESDIFKLVSSKKQPVMLPILSSGLPENDAFLDRVLSLGFSVMDKIMADGKIKALILMGDKTNGNPYSDSELEVFSTLSNMASLAMKNIYQYSMIEKMSYTDYLTELYNYRYFYKRLREEIYRAKRFDRMLALVIFDIDNFKVFNDNYGHQAGDEVLKNMAGLVTKSVRAIDIVSRYGGEEFCVIMPDTGFANCLIFVERLRKMIEGHKFKSKIVDEGYNITISIGGAIYPVDAQSADRLIYCSDMALLKAKSDGRNRSMMFNSLMLEDENLLRDSQQQLTDMGTHEDL
jgi:diguanylate cyclase (GGDEF)-like protein